MKFLTVLIVLVLNMAFAEDPGAINKDQSNIKNDQAFQINAQKGSMLKIVKVEPTVLFRKDQDGLMQAVDINIENSGQAVDAGLQVKFRSHDELSIDLGTIKSGKENYRFFVHEVSGTLPVEFALVLANKVQDRISMTWTPRKHWEVCLTPISHHDLGYTNTIERVLQQYCGIYDDVLRFCEETDNYPEEAKFRYNVEGAWSLQYFIERSDKATRDKLAKYMKEGRIEVHALFGNETTDLDSHEELVRLMYPSFRINREFGGKIKVGSITDMPGISWGLPTVMSDAGVKYFFAGLPDYFEWDNADKKKYGNIHTFWDEENILRHGKPDAFYWKGPDGSKVLLYFQGSYGCWSPKSVDQVMTELPGKLNEIDSKGNPFSVMRYGGYGCGDNTGTDYIRLAIW